ncbi:uncharacterized protein PHALS_03308 [Plasmopara halstedii]|uniref:Uncharacterized protein n=1 Tax=Plasmopara halstedii TaxID=4781 RepID=A0A0P1A8T3_PLAHL|nr:uncharacterized protein PHALS_03308 [Plasmopara halstedii]CEG36636.1 hypothetical protein PHALS_03308 [Plasmopara halstedii]|eukprot:XP_024573005.1 hypothetical protein PHALS_03308 [Plasmopara halstedii]
MFPCGARQSVTLSVTLEGNGMSLSASHSDSGNAQRMACVNARRDKRKPLNTDVGHGTTAIFV